MFCVEVVQAAILVSTADWNTNADTLIEEHGKRKDASEWLAYLLTYNDGLLVEAAKAERADHKSKELTFLTVAYFNSKLARQNLEDNKRVVKEYDKLELLCRQLTERIRARILEHYIRVNDPYFSRYYQEYRKSFGNYTALILRSP